MDIITEVTKITAQVNASTQLNTYDTIKTILQTSSVLNQRLADKDYYEFDPLLKGLASKGIPYIVITIPEVEDSNSYLGSQTTREKGFTPTIRLVQDWEARSNVKTYVSAILNIMDSASARASLRAQGYEYIKSDITLAPEPTLLSQKQVIVSEVEVMLGGEVV